MAQSRISALLANADFSRVDQIEPITDLDRSELAKAIEVCLSPAAEEQEFMVRFLKRCLPGVFDSDLIFYPFKALNAEQTLEEVLQRQEIKAKGGQAALNAYYRERASEVLQDPDAKPWSIDWAQGIRDRLS